MVIRAPRLGRLDGVVEVVQSAWGDWWIVADGEAAAVHLRGRSDRETQAFALSHARRLFPDRPALVRPFNTDGASARHYLVADKPHPLAGELRRAKG